MTIYCWQYFKLDADLYSSDRRWGGGSSWTQGTVVNSLTIAAAGPFDRWVEIIVDRLINSYIHRFMFSYIHRYHDVVRNAFVSLSPILLCFDFVLDFKPGHHIAMALFEVPGWLSALFIFYYFPTLSQIETAFPQIETTLLKSRPPCHKSRLPSCFELENKYRPNEGLIFKLWPCID